MSFVDHFTEFFFNKEKRLSSKAALGVFVILSVFVVDNILGFSYFYSTENKIASVQKLNLLLKDPSTDSITREFAKELRSKVMSRENIVAKTIYFFGNIRFSSSKKGGSKTEADNKISERSNFWFIGTSSGFYFLFAIIMIPAMLVTDKKTSFSQRLATGILATILLVIVGLFFSWVCDFIPQISKRTWIWNYLLNLLLQISFIGLLFKLSQKSE